MYDSIALVSCKPNAVCGAGGEASVSEWTAPEEMVLYIFHYTQPVNSPPRIYSKCAG